MKCKHCGTVLTTANTHGGRCPDCGAAVPVRQKIPGLIWFFAGIFLFGGILIMISAVFDGYAYWRNQEHYVSVDAVIVEIRTVITDNLPGEDEDVDHEVYVDYFYQGTDYRHMKLSWYDMDMREGATIPITIDSRSPGEIVTNEVWLVWFGLALTLVGCGILHLFSKGQKQRKT